jgi:hypothetical protein
VVGINGATGATEYLDGSGNWSTPAGVGTNLSNVIGTSNVEIRSSSGTNTDVPAATTTTAGAMTAADKLRLNQLQVTSNGTALGISPFNTSSNTLTMPWSGTSSQVVLGDGSLQTLSTIPGTYTWTIEGDTGGPTSVASGSAIDIAGGTNITTELVGTTLTINSSAGGGTVTSIDVQDGNFTTGSVSTSPNPITTSGNISFDLSAIGSANQTSFLRGDNKWSVLKNGKGINQISFSTTSPDYGTVLSVEYIGNDNVVKSANTAPATGFSLTDTVIINQASSSVVYEATLQSIKDAVVTSQVPAAFSVDASGNIQNSGNIADDPQGFGTITPTLESSGNGFVISFAKTLSNTNYMINFTVEEPLVDGGADYGVKAWVPSANKTTSGFTILYDKGGTASGLGAPELTNFQLYR